jgi:virulence factor Mce-like protein
MTDIREYTGVETLRARMARMVRQSARPTLVILAGLALGLSCLAYVIAKVTGTALVGTRTVSFALSDATGVVAAVDEVQFKGIPAGKITRVRLDGVQPMITVTLNPEFGRIYRTARAVVRPNRALQDMHLNIVDRSTPSAGLADGAHPVPASQTDTAVKISDVLNVFQGEERARLARLLDGLGNGLEDRGAQLRTAFIEVIPFLHVAARITDQLNRRGPQVKRLVHNLALLTTELGRRDGQLRDLVRSGSDVMATLQAGGSDLDATLHGLPPTIAGADASFTAVRNVLGPVDRARASLEPAVGELPQALTDVNRLAGQADPAMRALARPVRALRPVASELRPVADDLAAAFAALQPQVPAIQKLVSGVSAWLPAIDGFLQWDASMAKFGDVRGPSPRGNVVTGLQSAGVITDPNEYAPAACSGGRPINGRVPRPEDYK